MLESTDGQEVDVVILFGDLRVQGDRLSPVLAWVSGQAGTI